MDREFENVTLEQVKDLLDQAQTQLSAYETCCEDEECELEELEVELREVEANISYYRELTEEYEQKVSDLQAIETQKQLIEKLEKVGHVRDLEINNELFDQMVERGIILVYSNDGGLHLEGAILESFEDITHEDGFTVSLCKRGVDGFGDGWCFDNGKYNHIHCDGNGLLQTNIGNTMTPNNAASAEREDTLFFRVGVIRLQHLRNQ